MPGTEGAYSFVQELLGLFGLIEKDHFPLSRISNSCVSFQNAQKTPRCNSIQPRQGKLSSDTKPVLDISSPPEFKGIPGLWTPEDLFVASAEICTMSTFLSFGGRKNIPLVSYRSSAEGFLEFVEEKYRFTKIRIAPEITVGREWTREQVEEVVREAHDNCLIANSMTATVEIDPTIVLL